LLKLQVTNKDFFEQFSMTRSIKYYSIEYQTRLIQRWEQKAEQDSEYQFGIFRNEDHALLGTINLFQVQRGPLQSAFIGYFLDKTQNGKGYMTEAVRLIVDYAFSLLHLHRIEAGVMPRNIGSIRVLEKSGFHKEGLARKNVKINNRWEDHITLAIVNPNDI
jgi:ribosomal-protein-alanine N-acetyltransferase